MKHLRHKATCVLAAGFALLAPSTAEAAWEPAKIVDNQASAAGGTGNYVGLADGGNGVSTAFFSQTLGSSSSFYAIRRGISDAAWTSPLTVPFPASTVFVNQPVTVAADASGNAIPAVEQNSGGVPGVFVANWPNGASAPGSFRQLMSTPALQGGVTDPAVAFDSSGRGYAVAGVGQGASSDEPILVSTFSPSTGAWSAAAPITAQVAPGSSTCPSGAPSDEICGQEPRLAVSPDGSVVVAYLKTSTGAVPSTTQAALFAIRAPAGAVAGSGGAGAFVKEVEISGNGDQVPTTSNPFASPSTTPPNFDVTIDGSDVATLADAESQSGLNNQVQATRWLPDNVAPSSPVTISSAEPAPPASEPRLVSDSAGDVTAMWTEAGPNPVSASLVTAELAGTNWTTPRSFSTSADSPNNPSGYTVNTPPFSLAEDRGGNAFAVWTNGGNLVAATRSQGKNWNGEVNISDVSSAVAGTARVATGLVGQADALAVSGSGTRNALYASRFRAPVTPASSQPGTPKPGPPAVPRGSKPRPLVPCNARPVLRIFAGRSHVSGTRLVVAGRASEHRCRFPDATTRKANHVIRVYVSIYHPAPQGKCRYLKRPGKLTGPVPCTRPVAFVARGTAIWMLRLKLHVPAVRGGYLVRAWAVDGFGRKSVRGPASVIHLKGPRPKRKPRR